MRKQLKLNFNMGIASIHEVTTQLIGMQLSGANILALAVSATSVVAGTVSIAVLFYPRVVPLWIIAGLLGAGLAVLIEGLTLGALIRIRLANKKIRTIQAKLEGLWHEQLGKIEQPTPQADLKAYRANVQTYKEALKLTEADYRRKYRNATAQVRRARFWSCPLALFGATSSTCAGGMFYHTLLAQLAWYQSFGLSALFALAVTVTFVSSELFKDEQEQAIREGFKGGSLAEAAIEQETKRMTYRGVYNESLAFMQTDEARAMITEGFKDVLSHVIGEMKKREHGDEAPAREKTQLSTSGTAISEETQPLSGQEKQLFSGQREAAPVDREEDTFVDTGEHPIVDIENYRHEQDTESTKLSPKETTKLSAKQSTGSGRGTAQQKALRILKKNPGMSPSELAKKAQISRSYANRILSNAK